MKNIIITILLLMVIIISTPVLANENNKSFFATLEGKLLMSGNEPFTNLLIKVNRYNSYSISGEYLSELKKLSGATIRITGLVQKSKVPGTAEDIKVIEYTIVSPKNNLKSNWSVGKIYSSESGYVLIGDDQIIYNLTNAEVLDLEVYEHTKVLLFGDIDYYNDFYADFSIQGYNVLSEPSN
ncbi:hypothetical protein ACTWKD_05050 [Halanaerobium saccharolyticum]|uniref:hypothetical protein n=1 Tax=Halanaerobium saccharolyticum TaxID=43595 RepID=UPI003FCE12E4